MDALQGAEFLLPYTTSPEQVPSLVALIGFLGPLLGIAFGFDAVNNERAQGRLPRLVAQPIHRNDIINGKFVAGWAPSRSPSRSWSRCWPASGSCGSGSPPAARTWRGSDDRAPEPGGPRDRA
jgi:hypothetical protein